MHFSGRCNWLRRGRRRGRQTLAYCQRKFSRLRFFVRRTPAWVRLAVDHFMQVAMFEHHPLSSLDAVEPIANLRTNRYIWRITAAMIFNTCIAASVHTNAYV